MLDIDHPRLRELYDFWNDRRCAQRFPTRRQIDPVALKNLLGNIFVVAVERPGPRFRYRLVGTELTQVLGQELRGKYVDEMPFLYRKYANAAYLDALDRQEPVYARINAVEDFRIVKYERLLLPLSDNGDIIDAVVGGIYRAALVTADLER